MALSTSRSAWTARRASVVLRAVGRGVSSSTLPSEASNEDLVREGRPKKSSNPLLHAQTHTGIRNMAHGLHILRKIEAKFGAIESFLFPRESGTNEYHPTFFFRFREPKSIRRLAKPFTHLDIPALTLEDKPNHEVGINDVGYLISPNSHEFSLARGPELAEKEDEDSTGNGSEEDTTPGSPSQPSTLKSRYAVRISVSGLNEYPQPFFSHKTINPHEMPRIQRELADWKGAYEILGSNTPPSQKAQSIEELLQENFNVPQNTLVFPQRKQKQEPVPEENNTLEQSEQPPQPTEYQLFKIHSRRGTRPMDEDLPPDSYDSAEGIAESDSPITGVVANDSPITASSMQPAPQFGAKRERQLEQMRRTAASQARSIAEKQRVEEEAAEHVKAESETDQQIPPAKQEASFWDRFLRR
ncbi:unnamed protein product [Rhizoctonia solani]|uniref:Uncharacterized protein n=1 Tax=Rhizoctonia solani TaxID=456999 RepID=A0A8H2XCE9_9AGAM|nr:unnamed protein product [Rhizoctonia solani]